MTCEAEYPRNNSYPALVVFLCFVIVVLAAVVYGAHAVDRHGAEAVAVRNCLSQNGPMMTLYRGDGHRALVCNLGGRFGVEVLDKNDNEVTSFIKNKMNRLNQVIQYLENAGYH